MEQPQTQSQERESAPAEKKALAAGILGGPLLLGALRLERKIAGPSSERGASAGKIAAAGALAGASTGLLGLPAAGAALGMRLGTKVGETFFPGSGKSAATAQWALGFALGGAGAIAGLGLAGLVALPLLVGGAAAGAAMGLKGKSRPALEEKAKSMPPLRLAAETTLSSLRALAEPLAGRRTASFVRGGLAPQKGPDSENPLSARQE